MEPEIVDKPLVVTNLISDSTSICKICHNFVSSSHGCIFTCNCFVLAFTRFGIILGVRLQIYGVVVDCEGSLATIRADDVRRVVLGCLPIDGVMASFLNSLNILRDDLSDIPITGEYPDIFEEMIRLHHIERLSFRLI